MALMAGSHGCRYFQDESEEDVYIFFVGLRSPVTRYLDELGWEACSSGSCCGPNAEAVGVVVVGFEARVRRVRKLPSSNWKRWVWVWCL